MEMDDVIYLGILISTILLGYVLPVFCKTKESIKTAGCWIGFVIIFIVSGWHILHIILCIGVNCFIILRTSKRSCHLSSFAFTFTYLLFFRNTILFNISYPPGHTNLIQMILTLKLVGLAFEVHDSYVIQTNVSKLEITSEPVTFPKAIDIVQYSFFYVGVLTGPYYSYKTYQDYFNTKFDQFSPRFAATLEKLKPVPLFAAIFLLTSHYFPIDYAISNEFLQRHFFYRLLYVLPVFTTFRMRIYIGITLSECACTAAGFGAYPVETKPRPGMGPSTNHDLVKKLVDDENLAKTNSYNFESIRNIVPYYCEFDPTMRDTIKNWNMCVQYWLAYVVYKRFPHKKLRTLAVFAVSAYWHGVYVGYYFCLLPPPFYMLMEDCWDKILRKSSVGLKRRIIDVVFWIFRLQAFSYLGIAFSLLTTDRVLSYYRSVYYFYHLFCLFGLIFGVILSKSGKKNDISEVGKKNT